MTTAEKNIAEEVSNALSAAQSYADEIGATPEQTAPCLAQLNQSITTFLTNPGKYSTTIQQYNSTTVQQYNNLQTHTITGLATDPQVLTNLNSNPVRTSLET
jgi:hypothetical protein